MVTMPAARVFMRINSRSLPRHFEAFCASSLEFMIRPAASLETAERASWVPVPQSGPGFLHAYFQTRTSIRYTLSWRRSSSLRPWPPCHIGKAAKSARASNLVRKKAFKTNAFKLMNLQLNHLNSKAAAITPMVVEALHKLVEDGHID